MDRFDAMQAFARIVETGSFTKAADSLQISKTTVTQLVQQLEAHLRVKLLNRTTRKVNLTPDGMVYYERVLHLLADLDDAETSLSSTLTTPRGRLRVDVPSPFASHILIPALPDFQSRYPDIQLHLGVSDRVVDLIDERVDCVIRGGEISNQSLVARQIADLPLAMYAAPTYLARAGIPNHPSELALEHHQIVGLSWASAKRIFSCTLCRDGESIKVQGNPMLTIDDGNAYLAAGLAGIGAFSLPSYMAKAHVASGELIPLFTDWQFDSMPLYIAFPQNRHVSTKLRVFIDWIVELMAQQGPAISSPSIRVD